MVTTITAVSLLAQDSPALVAPRCQCLTQTIPSDQNRGYARSFTGKKWAEVVTAMKRKRGNVEAAYLPLTQYVRTTEKGVGWLQGTGQGHISGHSRVHKYFSISRGDGDRVSGVDGNQTIAPDRSVEWHIERTRTDPDVDGKGSSMHQGSSFSDNPSKSRGNRGRLKVRWGVYVDVDVPRVLEELIKGPWDPEGRLWARQVDMACEVIERSGGVVFAEQLAPILNPPEGPGSWGDGRRSSGEFVDFSYPDGETFVVRLLAELDGVPEVTSDGDILYVFRGLAAATSALSISGGAGRSNTTGSIMGASDARPDIALFQELPGAFESVSRIPVEGPKALSQLAQRVSLVGTSLFLTIALLLAQLLLGSFPWWLALGPIYLVWIAFDDTLRRSRYSSAQDRDRWRREWADYVGLGDADLIWRKRAAARRLAKEILEKEYGKFGMEE